MVFAQFFWDRDSPAGRDASRAASPWLTMATESTARSSDLASRGDSVPAPASDLPRSSERRVPTSRETLETLPELPEPFDFEPHDTIPAPPWLDEPEAEDEPAPTRKTP
jgi:hypothetical protein